MNRKQTFFTVVEDGVDGIRATFALEKDANLYGYVRFSDKHKVEKVKLTPRETYQSLQFKEGIAFNRIMNMRSDLLMRRGK